MITGSIISFLSGTFLVMLFVVSILFHYLVDPLELNNVAGSGGVGCRSTDGLLVPWATRLLFGLLQVSSSARYLIAWVAWLQPLGLLLILPTGFVILLYSTACLIQLYLLRVWLLGQLTALWRTARPAHFTAGPFMCPVALPSPQILRRIIAAIWDIHGRVFHGYEVHGLEKLPPKGPAFLVYYHGTLPLDAYYFMARHIIKTDRHPVPVVDRFLFRMPGLQRILALTGAFEGSVDECVKILRRKYSVSSPEGEGDLTSLNDETLSSNYCEGDHCGGNVLLLSPGGVREALFADEYYSVVWGKRRGFARVAIRAKQPIYPMFTENVREAIRVVQYGKRWWRRLYEVTRLPFSIFYGYFPVKLRTFIGDPIYPIESETDEDLADRVREAIEEMIRQHQWTPGNLLIALLQRIPLFDNWVISRNARHFFNSTTDTDTTVQ